MGSLSLEVTLKNRMRDLGISNDLVASLTGMSPARLSRTFRGVESLERAKLLKIDSLVGELEALVRIAEPFPLSFQNPARIESLLITLRERPEILRAVTEPFGTSEIESQTNQQ